MKFINFKCKLDINECKDFLGSRILSVEELGINWISSKRNNILLYYEDGTVTTRGDFKLLKSYFWGRIRTKNNQNHLTGIILTAPFTTVLSAVILLLAFLELANNISGAIFTIVFYIAIMLWFHLSERKNRKRIENYLHNIFCD